MKKVSRRGFVGASLVGAAPDPGLGPGGRSGSGGLPPGFAPARDPEGAGGQPAGRPG